MIKFFFFVPRPDNRTGSRKELSFSIFNPFNLFDWSNLIKLYRYVDRSAFPSVHAARLSVFAVVSGYSFGYFGFLLSLPFVVLVCYSRIARKRHSLGDILAGLVLGLLVSVSIILISGF
jgi:membrane-associated phospholipid phosphatase